MNRLMHVNKNYNVLKYRENYKINLFVFCNYSNKIKFVEE